MRITYIGAHDRVDIDETGQTVARGETVDVPDGLAGRPPDPRWLALVDVEIPAAVAALDHGLRVRLLDELLDLDPGGGLLRQTKNWQPAAKPAKAPKGDDGGSDQ